MRSKANSIIYVLVLGLMLFGGIHAQNETFSSPNHEYTFSLPDAKWKLNSASTAANRNVEYVYGERSDGYLEIRKLTVRKDETMSDVIQNEDQKLRFLPGYIAGKEENFGGKMRGTIFNYEYVQRGRAMSGRIYFFKRDETTVYALRFSGEKDSLRSISHQTDSIARTFAIGGN